MQKYTRLLLLIISFCFTLESKAQEPYSHHFTVSNGLPSNSIYSILEDKNGFIWFTSDEGLCRYDGVYFKSYKEANQVSYSGSGLMQDAKGRIWYQNFDGDSYYIENNQLNQFKKREKVNYFPTCSTEKHLFDKSKDHLDVYDLKTTKLLKSFKIKSEMTFTSVVFKSDYYFIENKTLYKITTHLNREKVANLPIEPKDFSILFSNNEHLLFVKKTSLNNGIWEIDKGSVRKIASFPLNQLVQGAKIINNLIFIQTTQGSFVYKCSGKQIGHFFFRFKCLRCIN